MIAQSIIEWLTFEPGDATGFLPFSGLLASSPTVNGWAGWLGIGLPAAGLLFLVFVLMIQRDRIARRSAVLASLVTGLGSARTVLEAARCIAQAAEASFGFQSFTFSRAGAERGSSTTILAIDHDGAKTREITAPARLHEPLSRLVLAEGSLLIPSLGKDPRYEKLDPGNESALDTSLMGVPLMNEGRALAIITVQASRDRFYRQEHLEELEALASYGSATLERIAAREEVDRLNRELRQHLEELQVLFNSAPVGIAVSKDVDCLEVSGNPAYTALFGPVSHLRKLNGNGADSPRIFRDGTELSPDEAPMRVAARQGRSVPAEELEVRWPGGRTIQCYASASPLYADKSEVRGALGIFLDISGRKEAEREIVRLNAHLEQRVQDRTVQLESINKELEAFSYSVSHDLRAPLRSIRGFSEVLLERYSQNLDERGRDYLHRVCDSCHHMDRLIEDLLKLSRVGRKELQPAKIDLAAMARDLIAELRKSDPEREVEVLIAPELPAYGDPRLLGVVMDNLLRNAWKFTRDQAHPRIEIGAVAGSEPTFYVRDNGAGFDMAYTDKLFGVFQRLHSPSDFPGTGVGLATVKRIITRHNGKVWADATPNQGAVFYFILPEIPEPLPAPMQIRAGEHATL